MAAVAPPSDQAAELLEKLVLDPQTKTLEVSEQAKKFAPIDSNNLVNGLGKPFERSAAHVHQDFVDPNLCYVPNGYPSPYYFTGYDGQMNEWGESSEIHGIYSDMYHGFGYPYGAYHPPGSPVSNIGHDGQLYGPQHYQYPTPYYQPQAPNGGPYTTGPGQATAPQGEVSTSLAADQVPLSVEATKGNTNNIINCGNVNGINAPNALRPGNPNSSLNSNGLYGRPSLPTGAPSSGYQDPRFGFDGTRSSIHLTDALSDGQSKNVASVGFSAPVSHANNFLSGRNQNFHPIPPLMHSRPPSGLGQASGFMSCMYPNNRMYEHYGNAFRTPSGFPPNGYDSRSNGRGWSHVDSRYRNKSRASSGLGYGNENMDGLNELNRGPRAKGFKNQKAFGPVVTSAVKGQNLQLNGNSGNIDGNLNLVPDKERFNREDFPENYSDAKFFVIKSYSEDDVHKSIKYNMWASTANGNKKLYAAYQDAQGKSGGCPVFLLFSVNASGQFVGVAEMSGSVDFDRRLEYWQQDKWTGCFPVKWHVIKDIPNSLLKHITLENNENKPVTNSRDTQEVKFEQGIQILKIFKNHSSKTTILDDFVFYEARQRTMQEKKAKQQLFQKQVRDVKPLDCVATENKDRLHQSVDVVPSSLSEESAGVGIKGNGELKAVEVNGTAAVADDAPTSANPVTSSENRVVPNGVANAC